MPCICWETLPPAIQWSFYKRCPIFLLQDLNFYNKTTSQSKLCKKKTQCWSVWWSFYEDALLLSSLGNRARFSPLKSISFLMQHVLIAYGSFWSYNLQKKKNHPVYNNSLPIYRPFHTRALEIFPYFLPQDLNLVGKNLSPWNLHKNFNSICLDGAGLKKLGLQLLWRWTLP